MEPRSGEELRYEEESNAREERGDKAGAVAEEDGQAVGAKGEMPENAIALQAYPRLHIPHPLIQSEFFWARIYP